MDHDSWIDLLADIIAAGQIERLPARTAWPMHVALASLYDESGRIGLRARAGLSMTFTPNPEVGRCAVGADAALRSLVRHGLLQEVGRGLSAQFEIDPGRAVTRRRRLLGMDPE